MPEFATLFINRDFTNMRQFNVHLNYQGPNKIVIFHGWIVDGLKINGQVHGGNGGNKTILHLQPGEKIRRIHGTRCRYIIFSIKVRGGP